MSICDRECFEKVLIGRHRKGSEGLDARDVKHMRQVLRTSADPQCVHVCVCCNAEPKTNSMLILHVCESFPLQRSLSLPSCPKDQDFGPLRGVNMATGLHYRDLDVRQVLIRHRCIEEHPAQRNNSQRCHARQPIETFRNFPAFSTAAADRRPNAFRVPRSSHC